MTFLRRLKNLWRLSQYEPQETTFTSTADILSTEEIQPGQIYISKEPLVKMAHIIKKQIKIEDILDGKE